MHILIIGAGWYGCHIASILLEKDIKITIVDKSNAIFNGSSSKNQNRLHLGFHYPRSDETIQECQKGYTKFTNRYRHLIEKVPNNLYCISNTDSNIDIETYMKKMSTYTRQFRVCDTAQMPISIQNIQYPVIEVDECYINPYKARDYFDAKLRPYLKILTQYDTIDSIVAECNEHYDLIINCTYNVLNPIEYQHYELFVTLLYKIDSPSIFAYTIMDGPFFSIYPYDIEAQIYTVTSVVHGIIYKGNEPEFRYTEQDIKNVIQKTETQIKQYIPIWDSIAKYVSYYTSWKTKHDVANDDRSVRHNFSNGALNIYGGKITGIFEAESCVLAALKCHLNP